MLAWECVDMMYEWTGAAGVSPPHLGVNERVQPGYLPLTYVVYEMVQLGYLPLTYVVYEMVQLGYLPLTLVWCSWGISPSPSYGAAGVSPPHHIAVHPGWRRPPDRHRCLVGIGPGVFAMWDQDARMYLCIFIWCMYMLCSVWYVCVVKSPCTNLESSLFSFLSISMSWSVYIVYGFHLNKSPTYLINSI